MIYTCRDHDEPRFESGDATPVARHETRFPEHRTIRTWGHGHPIVRFPIWKALDVSAVSSSPVLDPSLMEFETIDYERRRMGASTWVVERVERCAECGVLVESGFRFAIEWDVMTRRPVRVPA